MHVTYPHVHIPPFYLFSFILFSDRKIRLGYVLLITMIIIVIFIRLNNRTGKLYTVSHIIKLANLSEF